MCSNNIKLITTLVVLLTPRPAMSEIIPLTFGKWEIEYNCEMRGYENFHYKTVKDTGNLDRVKPFHDEKELPKRCRQYTTSSYKKSPKNQRFDRGHGVHSNIWDHDKSLMAESNSMSNVVPQASKLNRQGVWRMTEILTECNRDFGELEVWGGNVWGDDSSNDFFIESHGVVTPDYLWKIIKFHDGVVNAWLMPNRNEGTTRDNIDAYLVTPQRIKELTHLKFNLTNEQLKNKAIRSKTRPSGCSIK